MSVEFIPAIDLSFGFTLNAVGGVLGIEHRLDTDALRATITDGALDHILFPADPVAAAPAILDTLDRVFPVDPGSIVIGPMVEIGWGRPISFLTAQLGVIFSLPDPKIVIIGRVRIALPAPELPIVDLRATLYGEITPDYLLIMVSLRGSRIAGFTVGGDIGMLIKWGGGAEFAHQRRRLPSALHPAAAAGRHAAAGDGPVSAGDPAAAGRGVLRADQQQRAARLPGGDSAPTWGGLDHRPLLLRRAGDLRPALRLHDRSGHRADRPGVRLTLLRGQHRAPPRGHRRRGGPRAACRGGDPLVGRRHRRRPVHLGRRRQPAAAADRRPDSWSSTPSTTSPAPGPPLTPPGTDQLVHADAAPSPATLSVTVHPLGLFEVRQHAVPLETVDHPGRGQPGAGRQTAGPPGQAAGRRHRRRRASARSPTSSRPGNFLDLTDDQKLSRPSFEPMAAGARIRPPGEPPAWTSARQAELRYETFVADPDGPHGAEAAGRLVTDSFFHRSPGIGLSAGAAGPQRPAGQPAATRPTPTRSCSPTRPRARSPQGRPGRRGARC